MGSNPVRRTTTAPARKGGGCCGTCRNRKGFERRGSEWSAGGTPEPRRGPPAGGGSRPAYHNSPRPKGWGLSLSAPVFRHNVFHQIVSVLVGADKASVKPEAPAVVAVSGTVDLIAERFLRFVAGEGLFGHLKSGFPSEGLQRDAVIQNGTFRFRTVQVQIELRRVPGPVTFGA